VVPAFLFGLFGLLAVKGSRRVARAFKNARVQRGSYSSIQELFISDKHFPEGQIVGANDVFDALDG